MINAVWISVSDPVVFFEIHSDPVPNCRIRLDRDPETGSCSILVYICVTCCARLSVTVRVARLAFLRPNSRKLTLFKVVWHEKKVFGIYVIVWQFFGFFDGVGMKKHCLAFFWNLCLSYCCRLGIIELFLGTKVLSFLPRSHSWRHKRLCRLSDVIGQKTWYFFGKDFENCGSFEQCRLCGFRKINIKVYTNQVSCCAIQYLSFF